MQTASLAKQCHPAIVRAAELSGVPDHPLPADKRDGLIKTLLEMFMFVTPAFAQGGVPVGGDFLMSILPFILIFVIMYFLIIRPQRQRVKQHQELVSNLRRGDTVVTAGGMIGKVSKVVDDTEIQVEIAEGTKIRVVRSMIQEVRSKGEPAA